jgi:signal transduction histidine kinase
MAFADPTAVGSALDAVIDNAIKFSPTGSTVELALARDASMVAVCVRDEGPGVAPEELSAVGRRFWRSPRNVNVGGSGLGLSIATALLAASGGTLNVALAEPVGLAVTLSVPCHPTATPEAVAAPAARAQAV